MRQDKERATYESPMLIVHGTLEDVTQASFTGTTLDGDYPRGTPLTDPILGS